MKMRLPCIGFLLALAMLVACGRRKNDAPLAVRQSMSLRQLATIDSLMWWQPDSALQVLLDFADSPAADSLSGFEEPYCQLLVAELLYKNDYAQSNREELVQAVAYFDSMQHHSGNACGFSTDDMAFLDARVHYINGVGYYENDSLVPACQEYLKALEVMEETFAEKDLVGHKARFMALIYNRLGDLFMEQVAIESCIVCQKQALKYCQIESTSLTGISKILNRLGTLYNMMNDHDLARAFFIQARDALPNTENLTYRDIMACKALCDYQIDSIPQPSLEILRQILCQADDYSERLTRYLAFSTIFFEEKMYDSVLIYSRPIFENSDDIVCKIIVADYLRVVYESEGNLEGMNECTRFLADHKQYDGESKALASRLDNLFHDYQIQKQAKQAKAEREIAVKKAMGSIIIIALVVTFVVFIVVKRRSYRQLKKQQKKADKVLKETKQEHEKELEAHKMQQAALAGRLKQSNAALKELKERNLSESLAIQQQETALAYTEESICQHILAVCNNDKNPIKSTVPTSEYADIALTHNQKVQLKNAAMRHYGQLFEKLGREYPALKEKDFLYCYLCLS